MTAKCDNKSVGMLVWKEDSLLLIERAKYPFGFAPPAGHVDDFLSFEDAARQELKEEVGLEVSDIQLIGEGKKQNPCRREGGSWHYWKIYEVQAIGEIDRSLEETKQAGWYSKDEIEKLKQRTLLYLAKDISEDEWNKNPGMEPIWMEWLAELGK